MNLLKPIYDLFCRDEPTKIDAHEILAYKINPKLADITNRYYVPGSERRTLVTWINEFDNARVEISYDYTSEDFENIVIDIIYSLRNLYARNIIDLNSFRHYLADIAAKAYLRNRDLYKDIAELLRMLNCEIRIETRSTGQTIEEDQISNIIHGATAFIAKPEDFVKVTIIVYEDNKVIRGKKISILSIVPEGEETKKYMVSLITDEDGKVVIPARK